MKLFWRFCKDRRRGLWGTAACIALSGAVYFLYQLPPLPYFSWGLWTSFPALRSIPGGTGT